MAFKLQSKKIKICGETLTVWQASNAMDAKRSILISKASEKWNGKETQEMEEQALRYLETLLYPSLFVCTTGKVPTLEEFLNNLPAEDTEVWVDAARELNRRWFPDLVSQTSEEEQADLEKKDS